MGSVKLKQSTTPIFVKNEHIKILADALNKYLTTKEDTLVQIGEDYIKASTIEKISGEVVAEPEKEYSKQELQAFEKSISSYLVDGRLSLKSEMDLLKDKKYIRCYLKDGCSGTTITDFEWAIYQNSVGEYQNFVNILDAWKDWKGQIDYGKKLELRELDKLVDEKDIHM